MRTRGGGHLFRVPTNVVQTSFPTHFHEAFKSLLFAIDSEPWGREGGEDGSFH